MAIKVAKVPRGIVPSVHWDTIKKIKGKEYYLAEITTNAGTHGIYLDKKKVLTGKIQVRSKPEQAVSHSMYGTLRI